jgi:NTP pyrophosphatase (non-canonical NTP hydrolase)
MELLEYIKICGESANAKGWKITWETFPIFMALTAHEVLDAVDKGWRNDNKEKAEDEIGDTFVRLFHICHDLNVDLESILKRIIKNNKKRQYHHGHVRL